MKKQRTIQKLIGRDWKEIDKLHDDMMKIMRRSTKRLYPYRVILRDDSEWVLLSSVKLNGMQALKRAEEIVEEEMA